MSNQSRRSVLRSGAALALATSIAGCSGAADSVSTASGGIPGVEDGEIVDRHVFANAHGDQLAARTGIVEWARTSLDRETGEAKRHTVQTVRVDGDRVHAVVSGRMRLGKSDAERLEVFFEDDDTIFLRTRTDGEWTTVSGEPGEMALAESGFTGTTRLQEVSMRELGTETVDGEELYRFGNSGRDEEDGEVDWFSIRALVDEDALVHSFQQTLAGGQRNEHQTEEWYLTNLDATTVERPDWVAEADS